MTIMHYQEACYSAETDDDDFEEEKKECLKNLMILITMHYAKVVMGWCQ